MTPKEFKRLYRIVSILLEQGIDELGARPLSALAWPVWPVPCSGSEQNNRA